MGEGVDIPPHHDARIVLDKEENEDNTDHTRSPLVVELQPIWDTEKAITELTELPLVRDRGYDKVYKNTTLDHAELVCYII